MRPGERAEAFYRFPEGQRNFLGYRQLRVWARGRGSGWDNDQLSFYIKVAQDENNFYMFRAHVHSGTWLPELVVDFTRWLTLRADIERRFLSGQPPSGAAACGGDTLAYVACDSARSYIVHVRNPGVAPPNLASVAELAVGFVRDSGASTDSAEVWVDDIRLAQVVNDPGYAGALNLRVVAADVGDLTVAMSRRDPQFRQLGDNPSYTTSSQFSLGATVRLERFGLDRLGLTAPFSMRMDRSSDDPYYLEGTDVLAGPLAGLRRPQTSTATYNLMLRRSRRGTKWWQRWIVDNLGLSASYSNATSTTQLAQSSAGLWNLNGDYAALPSDRSFRFVPRFLARLLRAIPLLGRADFVRGLDDARLRWSPASVRFTSGFTSSHAELETFRVPIATVSDTLATSVRTLAAAFRNQASVEFRPLRSASFGVDYASTRDLKDYGDSSTMGVLTHQAGAALRGAQRGLRAGPVGGDALHLDAEPLLVAAAPVHHDLVLLPDARPQRLRPRAHRGRHRRRVPAADRVHQRPLDRPRRVGGFLAPAAGDVRRHRARQGPARPVQPARRLDAHRPALPVRPARASTPRWATSWGWEAWTSSGARTAASRPTPRIPARRGSPRDCGCRWASRWWPPTRSAASRAGTAGRRPVGNRRTTRSGRT